MKKEKKEVDFENDKLVEKFIKNSAIKEGEAYFDQVINSLKGAIEDVKRNKRSFNMALRGKPYPNGFVPDKKLIVQQIEWNIHAVQQIDLHHSKGARAIGILTNAFKLQL